MISPLSVSSAAPTLNPEKSETACSRARRAASTSLSTFAKATVDLSEAANDALEQRDELALDLLRRLHHFRMVQRLRKHAGRGVGDTRDAEHFHAHMAGNDGFRCGGHPD